MIPIRQSTANVRNALIEEIPADGKSNSEWLATQQADEGIILLGGNSVSHFQLRVAQSHLRIDLTPSCWSLVGILVDSEQFLSAPLSVQDDASMSARTNGVRLCALSDYDNADEFPNIGVIRFAENHRPILSQIQSVLTQRSIIDLPNLLLSWLGFIWGVGQLANPLYEGKGIPSAAFVETVYALAGIELTPGLASSSSCPEAIWQSATWWYEFYGGPQGKGDDTHAVAIVPTGKFTLRQPAAAAVGPKDVVIDMQIVRARDVHEKSAEMAQPQPEKTLVPKQKPRASKGRTKKKRTV